MTFAFEGDDLQPEIEQLTTDQKLEFWPKVDGKGVAASSTVGDNKITIYDFNAVVLVPESNISPTAVGTVSKFVATIAATPAATWPKREGYETRFTWRVTGETEVRTNEVEFAVVARRWPDAISLNDLQSQLHYAGELCQAIATAQGLSSPEDAARNPIYEAKRDLDAFLRNAAAEAGHPRPTLVYDQRLLRRWWTRQALAKLLLSAARMGGDADGMFSLYREWKASAEAARDELGDLRFDLSDDGLPDTRRRPGVSFWSR